MTGTGPRRSDDLRDGPSRRAPVRAAEIDAALAARGLSPLKRFGQHFLVRPEILDRIVELAAIAPGDVVLEVGPGTGGLTERLLSAGARVAAVEIDRGLHAFLQELLAGEAGLSLSHQDVMERKSRIAPGVLAAIDGLRRGGAWKVVSNLPYQISSPFLAALPALDEPPAVTVVTVQKEVGDVLRASPGDEEYSPLSLAARLYFLVTTGPGLGPASFHPRPEVDSVVLRLDRAPARAVPARTMLGFARILFQSRRKALSTSLPRAIAAVRPGAAPTRETALECLRAAGLRPADRVDGIDPDRLERMCVAALGW